MASTDQSIIGRTARVVGRVEGQGHLLIEGNVRGDINVTGAAEVAPDAAVEGTLEAESVELLGRLEGAAAARGPVRVRASAAVSGELRGSEVSIEPGAVVNVRLDAEFELDL